MKAPWASHVAKRAAAPWLILRRASPAQDDGAPVVLVSAAMFLLSGGENLWRKFLPQYLRALGAPIRAVGFYGSLEDFLDGIYQYPGGFLGDHLGRRKALLLFVALAMA